MAGLFALFGLVAFVAWRSAGSREALAKHSIRSVATAGSRWRGSGRPTVGSSAASPRARSIQVGSGATLKRFDVSEPAGVIRLLRVTVPRGTRANLTGVIPQVAGVGISTRDSTVPSETCQSNGAVEVCAQAEEACPMPAATWQFRLHKLAGPAGEVRLEFVVG
jgi:hypothetical protein